MRYRLKCLGAAGIGAAALAVVLALAAGLTRSGPARAELLRPGVPVVRSLALPPRQAGDAVVLTLRLGLGPGEPRWRVVVRRSDGGELIGSVAPFADPAGGTKAFSLRVPAALVETARAAGATLSLSIAIEPLPGREPAEAGAAQSIVLEGLAIGGAPAAK